MAYGVQYCSQLSDHPSGTQRSDDRIPISGTVPTPYIWVNYNDLTTTSLEIMVSKGNHPQMALIQISELL